MSDTDDIWLRDEIDSPCVKLCVVHPKARICVGCFRSIDEIRDWSKYTPEQRREIMAELPAREPQLKQGRRGRADRFKT